MSISTAQRKKTRLLVISAVFFLAAAGLYGALLSAVKSKNEHISDLANKIEVMADEGNARHGIKSLVQKTAPLRAKLDGLFVGKDDAVSFIEMLEQTGETVGVDTKIASVTTYPVAGHAGLESLQLTLSVSGTFASVTRYLGLLELIPYQTTVDQVIVSHTDEAGSVWHVNLKFSALKEV